MHYSNILALESDPNGVQIMTQTGSVTRYAVATVVPIGMPIYLLPGHKQAFRYMHSILIILVSVTYISYL